MADEQTLPPLSHSEMVEQITPVVKQLKESFAQLNETYQKIPLTQIYSFHLYQIEQSLMQLQSAIVSAEVAIVQPLPDEDITDE